MSLSKTETRQIITLDLNFMGVPGTIAAYLVPHRHGALLVESGPGSTVPALEAGLKQHGYTVADVTDVLLTHIHLDHAGAAGWLARQGARVHVHPAGAPHLLNPTKLLESARRIYGETMDILWGEFLPVPEEQLVVVQDGDETQVGGVCLRAIETLGHASHHHAYRLEQTCFTGDIGGVRLPGPPHLRLPMPPPEFNLEEWRLSVERLAKEGFSHLAPTHFGVYDDAGWHLDALRRALDDVEEWMQANLPGDPPYEVVNDNFVAWSRERSQAEGLLPEQIDAYETANPSWMSTYGLQRYWKKFRG